MDRLQLSDKQFEILKLLYRFRFLTSNHLQHLLNDKTSRLTNYHLKKLTTQNYIGNHYSRKLGEANQPAIYYLTSASINILKQIEEIDKNSLNRIYREKIRSKQFIAHAMYIADYYLFLQNESLKSNHTLHFFTKSDLLPHKYILRPLPDFYFARVDSDGNIKRYFVEVLEENIPRFAVRKRIDQYNDYIESGKFESVTSHPFPTLLIICPSYGSKIYIKKHLQKVWESLSFDQISIFVTTNTGAFAGEWEKVTDE